MSQRSDFLLKVLENIGVPLMAAINDNANRTPDDATPVKDAERMAELLGRCVQVSVALSGSMDMREGAGGGDSVRVALAALAAGLLGGHYKQTGKMPGDNDIKRLTTALEAVLTFSDNFAPAADNIARLENMAPGMADENQVNIQYINLFVPVVVTAMRFPFGQPEKKLVQDVAGRLIDTAAAVRGRLQDGSPEAKGSKQTELQILQGLIKLYVSCHDAETDRLMEARDGGGSIEGVWKAFDTGLAMLELLSENAIPDDTEAASTGGSWVAPAAATQPPPPPAAPPPL
ncbi:MAG TPA: hypothetical protein VIG74_04490, partial [Alphaproteobacteria bacterium]